MKTKLKASVFRAAAKYISTYWDGEIGCIGCCRAIDESSSDSIQLAGAHQAFMDAYFKPPRVGFGDFWWSWHPDCDQSREARIIALLLAALLVEEGAV